MGYIAHHAIVVTSTEAKIAELYPKALEMFANTTCKVSEPTPIVVNDTVSLFVAPDGSKEGWDTSDEGDIARYRFIRYLEEEGDDWYDWVEVRFGGDEPNRARVENHS